jgi:hypothetical protein
MQFFACGANLCSNQALPQELVAMLRALIQPQGAPAPLGVSGRRTDLFESKQTRIAAGGAMRPGFGLLVAGGLTLGLWLAIAKIALQVLQ